MFDYVLIHFDDCSFGYSNCFSFGQQEAFPLGPIPFYMSSEIFDYFFLSAVIRYSGLILYTFSLSSN